MKKFILIGLAITTSLLSLASCKKTSPEPISAKSYTSTNTIRIQVTSTVSASDGKFDGFIQVITDTVLNTVLFNRGFSDPFGCSAGIFDTTFVVTSQNLNINTLLFTEKWTGSIYDVDPIADTYMTIWVNGVKKLYLKNTAIAESIYIE